LSEVEEDLRDLLGNGVTLKKTDCGLRENVKRVRIDDEGDGKLRRPMYSCEGRLLQSKDVGLS